MAGIHFQFADFKQLLRLNIGIADRLDENRAESFTILYCDFSKVQKVNISDTLSNTLRTSDTIANYKKDYFFVLPYTDKYGAEIVKKQLDEKYGVFLNSFLISYPVDGENADELVAVLQNSVKHFCKKNIDYLDILE
ncbi:hypothetical protein M947_02450 [Sulfurimonas hongkongensis]|uniref:GGDEF domain-containing protein n=1 Tax=Sulfurimonas hongkongensis TaxID=1172190 RepID=T0KTD0_9BACT|nr:hypothetical protein [Sulfurimonas hongkongensis]EQB40214.1 hypothetical protein M947_02450 [Sulfurimonas hongkongensis]